MRKFCFFLHDSRGRKPRCFPINGKRYFTQSTIVHFFISFCSTPAYSALWGFPGNLPKTIEGGPDAKCEILPFDRSVDAVRDRDPGAPPASERYARQQSGRQW